jgi:hypothetical protein
VVAAVSSAVSQEHAQVSYLSFEDSTGYFRKPQTLIRTSKLHSVRKIDINLPVRFCICRNTRQPKFLANKTILTHETGYRKSVSVLTRRTF